MFDIALKALSHAVNDPSRAVQALDEIDDILAELAPDIAKRETLLAAHPDASVLRDWTRSWADYVAAATDEIRQYGTGSVQIQRRLRVLFDTLAGSSHLPALLRQRRGVSWALSPLGLGSAHRGTPSGHPGTHGAPGLIGHRLHPEHRTGTVEGLTQCGDARHRDAAGPQHRGAPDQATPARAQSRAGQLGGARRGPSHEVGDPDPVLGQQALLVRAQPPRGVDGAGRMPAAAS